MNQAIKEGKSIEQVTAESSNLTMAEFKAIMDINKNLKY
jgi:aspartate ammonia-lyase